ncbi:hypothetical protein CMI37_26740 [Candidatus Pacearchaeota archaeon]|nr:hypothetical protein [Candidatus Pacearchaeota archaeon]|tara:strand:+ start:1977 stop:2348 length:372 start_codon:yes stop_codon:yes gene_type:complete
MKKELETIDVEVGGVEDGDWREKKFDDSFAQKQYNDLERYCRIHYDEAKDFGNEAQLRHHYDECRVQINDCEKDLIYKGVDHGEYAHIFLELRVKLMENFDGLLSKFRKSPEARETRAEEAGR